MDCVDRSLYILLPQLHLHVCWVRCQPLVVSTMTSATEKGGAFGLASDHHAATSDSEHSKHGHQQHHYGDGTRKEGSVQDELTYQYDESRKLGVTSSVFVILNKMIGTGIFSTPSGIFAATGSVGVSLFLWVIGGVLTFCGLSAFVEFGLTVSAHNLVVNVVARWAVCS